MTFKLSKQTPEDSTNHAEYFLEKTNIHGEYDKEYNSYHFKNLDYETVLTVLNKDLLVKIEEVMQSNISPKDINIFCDIDNQLQIKSTNNEKS